jgi:iron complex outermembrane receptor protein
MLNFFTNAFDTRTQGIDLVASYHWKMGRADRLTLTTAFNHNETKMLRAAPGLVSNEGRTNIERRLPRNVGNISVDYATGKLDLVGRVRYFGTWTDAASPVLVQTFSQQIYFDASATWKVTKNLNVTVGAENIFNRYPDKALFNVAAGLVYSRFAPYDTDGGRWYTRVGFSF